MVEEGAGGQEPGAWGLSGGAMYHHGTAMYHHGTAMYHSSAPSPRNLGSELPCITPLPGTLLPCIRAPTGPKLQKVARCIAAALTETNGQDIWH